MARGSADPIAAGAEGVELRERRMDVQPESSRRGGPPQKRSQRKPSDSASRAAEQAVRGRAETLFEEGQRAHAAGDLSSAVDKYSAALEIIPDFVEVLYQRGMAYFALKQWDLALGDLGRVSEQEKDLLPSDIKTADPTIRNFFARTRSAMAEIHLVTGAREAADAQFQRAIDLDPALIRARLQWARSLIDRGAYPQAEALLQSAVAPDLASAEAYTLLGYAQELGKRPDAALQSYSRAIELDSNALAARQHRAGLWAAAERWEKAADDLGEVLKMKPAADTATAVGRLWERANRPDRALEFYREASRLDPADLEVLMRVVEILAASGQKEEAVPLADLLFPRASDRAGILGRLGQALMEVDPSRSAAAFIRAAKLDANEVAYQVGLGAALVKLRKLPDAVGVLSAVLSRYPENYTARANLAAALFEQKDYAAATPQFEWLLVHKPDTVVAYYFLGICYDKLQMYDRALNRFEQFLTLADAERNRAEIDNVRYHLPTLRRLVERGKGSKAKGKRQKEKDKTE